MTVTIEGVKNKKKMVIISGLWLIDKYRKYPKIVEHKVRSTISLIKKEINGYSTEELYNDLVNEVSHETLINIQGEKEMKNVLIGGLVLLMMSGLFVSCPEKPEDDKDKGNSHNGLKVAEEYRGNWHEVYRGTPIRAISFQLTSSERIPYYEGEPSNAFRYPAWTVDNKLWIYSSLKDTELGTFTDSSTYVSSGNTTYVKK